MELVSSAGGGASPHCIAAIARYFGAFVRTYLSPTRPLVRSRDDELIGEILKGGIATAPEAGELIFAEVAFLP
ncbi:hypothetical protein [Microbispora bryophytorum]|uniref:Uncharacterized protein n=1 Tax=Microbispora bryophytorum subsp. camponoti TaxID=1677852 RepID=A0ABR8KY22_9ACTN|nr:hypothetical protein [Microbispora camponoti]MBD3141990.1 hypothetical protein [Microbispora camponoti]